MVIQIGESIEVQSPAALVPMEPYPSIFECVRPYEGRSDAAIGTSVWTGRALQVGYDGLEIVGLAHLYSAL